MKTILNPNLYHGAKKKSNFFEGWYFKIVDKNSLYKFAFIPGIALGQNISQNHSFIQIVDGRNNSYQYLKFDEKSFGYNNNNFNVNIKSNVFSLDKIHLSLDYNRSGKAKEIKGTLNLKNIISWPDSIVNPGSMGFYNYLLFMECYSQVCALNGEIEGSLKIDGEIVDFTGGKVYIEKNWGKSFPKSWIWIQSNSFENKSVSVTCSLATIPFPIRDFRGFLIGVTINSKFISFTTINNSKLLLKSLGQDVELVAAKGNLQLTLKTKTDLSDFVLCMAPKNGHMIPLVKETLSGTVEMILEDIASGNIIFKGIGKNTGVEYGGSKMDVIDDVN